MKQKAKKNALDAFDNERNRAHQFDPSTNQQLSLNHTPENLEHPQPSIFKGNLKGYQLKGMNWLANLYSQVRNHIIIIFFFYSKCCFIINQNYLFFVGYQWDFS